jgi:uncharacterized integral membrane protein
MTPEAPQKGQAGVEEAKKGSLVSHFSARQVVLAVLALLALAFAFSNSQSVEVHYLIGTSEVPLWFLIVASMVFGVLLDRGMAFRSRRKNRD